MQSRSPVLALLAAASLAGLVLVSAPAVAKAQSASGSQIITSLEFSNVDVRQALRDLFKNVGVSYTIDPGVQGTVTLALKNVPFDTALQNLARQVDATYRIEGGVYMIVPRNAESRPELGTYVLTPPAKLAGDSAFMVLDGKFLFAMHDGVVDKIEKRTMKVVGTALLSKGK